MRLLVGVMGGVVWQGSVGVTQALLGTAAATATVFAHTQLFAQSLHRVRASLHRIADILFCDSSADANVHTNNPVNTNEIYSRLHYRACQVINPRCRYVIAGNWPSLHL